MKDIAYECIINILKTGSDNWPKESKEGWLIPLLKKGTRKDFSNYRGVCLLPLARRIIARVLASSLRIWAETIELMEENQHGFRKGRSTADATQAIIRIDDETRRVLGPNGGSAMKRPVAVLLNITKAYPRVNRVLLWGIRQKQIPIGSYEKSS